MSERRLPRRPTTSPAPKAGIHVVATGTAELVPDGDGRGGWTVMVNGVPSSHVDPADPLRLDFEYMRWIGDLVDVTAPAGEPLHTLHLGGAGCTLARYIAAARPMSRQLVIELDPALVDLVREAFGLRSSASIRVRAGDARAALIDLPDDRYHLTVRDAFAVDQVPGHLRTRGFLTEVARVLRPGGIYVANLGDGGMLEASRREAATTLAVFRNVAIVAEPAQFHGRRYGNVLVIASDAPLPLPALARRLASGPVRARMLEDDEVVSFAAGLRPIEDPMESC